MPDVKVEVGGHTDNSGDPDMNKRLSLSRARAVVDAGVAGGVAAEDLALRDTARNVRSPPTIRPKAARKTVVPNSCW